MSDGTATTSVLDFPGMAALHGGVSGFVSSAITMDGNAQSLVFGEFVTWEHGGHDPWAVHTISNHAIGENLIPLWLASLRDVAESVTRIDVLASGSGKDHKTILESGHRLRTGEPLTRRDMLTSLTVARSGLSATAIGRIDRGDEAVKCALHFPALPSDPSVIATVGTMDRFLRNGETRAGLWLDIAVVAPLESTGDCVPPSALVGGQVLFAGGSRGLLAQSGSVLLEEGDAICGRYLVSAPLACATNSAGDYAVIWPTNSDADPSPRPTLIANGRVLLTAGETRPEIGQISHIWPQLAMHEPNGEDVAKCLIVTTSGLLHLSFETAGRTNCSADFDGSGQVDIDDLMAFLEQWHDGSADVDCDGVTDSSDVEKFASIWMAGC
jgi:hypothetical protein